MQLIMLHNEVWIDLGQIYVDRQTWWQNPKIIDGQTDEYFQYIGRYCFAIQPKPAVSDVDNRKDHI